VLTISEEPLQVCALYSAGNIYLTREEYSARRPKHGAPTPANDRRRQGTVELPSTGSLITCPKGMVDRSGSTKCRAQMAVGLNGQPCIILHVREVEWVDPATHDDRYGLGKRMQCAANGTCGWGRRGSFLFLHSCSISQEAPLSARYRERRLCMAWHIQTKLARCTTEVRITVWCNLTCRISR
jgi:hypothetical protein